MSRLRLATAIHSILSAGALLVGSDLTAQGTDMAPVVPSLVDAELTPAVRGRVLLVELGCTNCHRTDGFDRRLAPELATVGSRVRADYLRRFLAAPNASEPGTPMPTMLGVFADHERDARVDELVHYLRSFGDSPNDELPADAASADLGEQLWNSIGCRNCHDTNQASRANLADKYTLATLQQFLLAPHEARPAQRMPKFALTPNEAFALANHLMRDASKPTAEPAVDPARRDAGRALFGKLRCNSCHELADPKLPDPAIRTAKPLDQLDPARGCLSGHDHAWPSYALSAAQRSDILAALQTEEAATAEQRIQQHMASRNCFACHTRGDVDATEAKLDLFETHDPSIGMEGMFPPTLTGVGAKLQRQWLGNAIAHGQHERPYLKVRMPGFGEQFANTLADELAATDKLEPITIVPLPKGRKEANKIRDLGAQLVGDKAMNCIVCHEFAGENFGQMPAIDLVHSTGQRLRPEWFAHFLRDPFRFKPNTLMTRFFLNGRSTRPEFADGDVDRQISAIWHYLATGRNVRKPRGMRRPQIELKVGDEAVLLRRAVQDTGKRGISVGYPGGVNITFDSETLAMNHVWWGRFLDARPVWTSQGHGRASILERQRSRFPLGPAFAPLADASATWPDVKRRERGDRWLGYDLDDKRRPTLRYTCGDVTIADKPQEATVDGKLILRRTLRFTGTGKLAMLVARHPRTETLDAHTARIDNKLTVRCADTPFVIVTDDKQKELRLAVDVQGERTLMIEYHRSTESR